MTATCKPVNVMVFLYLRKNKLLSCKSIRKRLLFSLFFVIYVLCLYAIFRMWIFRMWIFRMRFFH